MFCIRIYSDYSSLMFETVSRGNVATRLRCGGTFNNHGITNFSQSVAVKEFVKSVNIWRRYGQ